MRVTRVSGLKRSKRVKMRHAGLVKRAAGPLAAPTGGHADLTLIGWRRDARWSHKTVGGGGTWNQSSFHFVEPSL
ncbi:hypothetical protein AMECASPLE_034755 [Ameca splendens]|uniref:Uncharacterized protein n=1 Tax=Ameca splendens TaxID=208324 RepID=A0ABV0Z5H5_9TELE